MRTHGAPGFATPTSPRAFKQSLAPSAPGTTAPAFQAAEASCQHLLPGGGPRAGSQAPPSHEQLTAMVAFAGCLRGRGFTRFPDPTPGGQLTYQMIAAAGIDIHQPAVAQAADACVGVTHGLLNRAAVAKFIAEH
jgi:hypothetical protein